jgi:acylphosphatase
LRVVPTVSVTRVHVWVSGRVQGVWYRQSCAQEARAAGVAGWVSNMPDGRVEAVFEGDAAAVDALVSWCRLGPPRASVTDVKVVVEDVAGGTERLTGFRVG